MFSFASWMAGMDFKFFFYLVFFFLDLWDVFKSTVHHEQAENRLLSTLVNDLVHVFKSKENGVSSVWTVVNEIKTLKSQKHPPNP